MLKLGLCSTKLSQARVGLFKLHVLKQIKYLVSILLQIEYLGEFRNKLSLLESFRAEYQTWTSLET